MQGASIGHGTMDSSPLLPAETIPLSPGQFVWVRVGKTDHAAHIVACPSSNNAGIIKDRDGKYTVKWATTGTVEDVRPTDIMTSLTPRKRRRQQESKDTKHGCGSSGQRRGKKSVSKLSLKRNRLRLAQGRSQAGNLGYRGPRGTSDKPAKNREGAQLLEPADSTDNGSCNIDGTAVSTLHVPSAAAATMARIVSPPACSAVTQKPSTTKSSVLGSASTDLPVPHSVASSNDNPTTYGKSKNMPASTSSYVYHHPASSAYVQHLSEICYTILNDQRWRVPSSTSCTSGSSSSVLSWESGDDLSAVSAFASIWDGRVAGKEEHIHPGFVASKGNENGYNYYTCPSGPSASIGRGLNVYSRLFVRKGPWFTIDDIYFRYYRNHYMPISETEFGSNYDDCEDNDADSNEKPCDGTEVDAIEKDGKDESMTAADDRNSAQATLESHRKALAVFFTDIIYLNDTGLLRTFHSERECGIIAGNTSSNGSGVLLNSNLRDAVLEKLGGSKRLKGRHGGLTIGTSAYSSSAISNGRGEDRRLTRRSSSANIIWQQMNTQQSVVAAFGGASKSSARSLPVKRHVHDVVWTKFASRILASIGHQSRSSSSIAKAKSLLSSTWSEATRMYRLDKAGGGSCPAPLPPPLSSVRLREAPLLILRRAARLYLCAGGGPGMMRGDSGANGWASVFLESFQPSTESRADMAPEILRLLESGSTWHKISYPGLNSRFGLSLFSFTTDYEPLSQRENSNEDIIIFSSREDFHRWEICAEMRATVDRVLELNEVLHYLSRRAVAKHLVHTDDRHREDFFSCNAILIPDTHALLTLNGRRNLVKKLVSIEVIEGSSRYQQAVDQVATHVESTINDLVGAKGLSQDSDTDPFSNDAERIVCVMAILGVHVLLLRFRSIGGNGKPSLINRPWLRHLSWESVLSYILWDCVSVLEKKKCYELAVLTLKTILMGNRGSCDQTDEKNGASISHRDVYVRSLLSRRVRGKAFERLVIDQSHLEKLEKKKTSKETKSGGKKNQDESLPLTDIQNFCLNTIVAEGGLSSIPFSAVRSLARRMKVPLKRTLVNVMNAEMDELGIRQSGNTDDDSSGYSDWRPTTDHAVANAISHETTNGIGKRCAFVGWETEDDTQCGGNVVQPQALNVEELALEEYASGRLPKFTDSEDPLKSKVKGGWVGWHDEGGRVRALFRILCAPNLTGGSGMDNCDAKIDKRTLFLTPMQGAPLDLHVGYQELLPQGFYKRRKSEISRYLTNLEAMTPQEICNAVYESVMQRLQLVTDEKLGPIHPKDVFLSRDIGELRTLCLIAAGLGGRSLAAIFRCLCFDYRHYSGGLPDLLLGRALYVEGGTENDGAGDGELVDLGDWIGEAFSSESIKEGEVVKLARILADRDDEFLGCDKVGESGASASSKRWSQRKHQPVRSFNQATSQDNSKNGVDAGNPLPSKLILSHNGRSIRCECMFVEVKSANDRLDVRQEDWLNVLDRVGNARVCKFDKQKGR